MFHDNFGNDVVTDFQDRANGQNDILEFSNTPFANYTELMAAAAEVDSDVVITVDADNSVTLRDVSLSQLGADDFLFVA